MAAQSSTSAPGFASGPQASVTIGSTPAGSQGKRPQSHECQRGAEQARCQRPSHQRQVWRAMPAPFRNCRAGASTSAASTERNPSVRRSWPALRSAEHRPPWVRRSGSLPPAVRWNRASPTSAEVRRRASAPTSLPPASNLRAVPALPTPITYSVRSAPAPRISASQTNCKEGPKLFGAGKSPAVKRAFQR